MKNLTLVLIAIISLASCSKEDSSDKPQQSKTIQVQEPVKASDQFVGNWINGELCGTKSSILIVEGANDTTVNIFGAISAKIYQGKFTASSGSVYHTGELINGNLKYCQYSGSVKCCGTFYKE